MRTKNTYKLCWYLGLVLITGCGKNYLDLKPDQSQRVPVSISDFQAMMDNTGIMNSFSSHALGIIGADEYVVPDNRYSALPAETDINFMKRAYNWNEIIFTGGEQSTDWGRGYSRILQANIVLDGLKKVSPRQTEINAYNQVKGEALFHRAINYYDLAQLFCEPFNAATAGQYPGLPLRMEADVTIKTNRANLAQTYEQISKDLEEAVTLLPDLPKVGFRPGKAAAFALLARLNLQLENYGLAAEFATKCLGIKKSLLDFNTLNLMAVFPFPSDGAANPEILFSASVANIAPVGPSFMDIEADFLIGFATNDLRRELYFYNLGRRNIFTGSYTGNSIVFTGLAVDEVLLTRAECYARQNKISEAMRDLNELCINRYDKNTFVSFSLTNQLEALTLILAERRKELLFRGCRWEDLRRLNKDIRFAKKLTRNLHGEIYELKPNDLRYVWPIPLEAITAGGYTQNPR